MRRARTWRSGGALAVLAWLATAGIVSAAIAAPTVFARLFIPVGVETDRDGNILVTSDAVTSTLITKFAPTGQQLGQVPLGNFFSVGEIGQLARDPVSGLIWGLTPTGNLYILDPSTLGVAPLGNVKAAQLAVNAVFDLESRQRRPFAEIHPEFGSYGDLALLRRGDRLDAFVTGYSLDRTAFPFVARLRFRLTPTPVYDGGEVVLSSKRQPPPVPGVDVRGQPVQNKNANPRGVAVRQDGLVLTTHHVPAAVDTQEVAVAFSADFPEGGGMPPTVVGGGRQLNSRGMTADAAGNFYVATAEEGAPDCGVGGSGALVIVSALDLNRFECGVLNQVVANSRDVAVSPTADAAYLSVLNLQAVVRFGVIPPVPPPPPPAACTPRPRVQVVVTREGPDQIRAAITPTGQNNRVAALQFLATTNAVVDTPDGRTGVSGAFTVDLPALPAQAVFSVRRVTPGQAMTVPLAVVDRCGSWQTFVGLGTG